MALVSNTKFFEFIQAIISYFLRVLESPSTARKTFRFTPPNRFVKKVYIHCSDSDLPQHDNVKTIKDWHLERGFNDIGYHFIITQDGVLHKGRNIEKIPAAQIGYNAGSIAICLTGRDKFSEGQFKMLNEFCNTVNKAYNGSITFHGHCEVSDKTCPNFNYAEILNLSNNKLPYNVKK